MKRNKFSLSHFKLMSFKLGQLVPLFWGEAIPGDTWQMSTSALVRVAPLVSPPLHPVHLRIHHFFVPNRIIWQGSQTTGSAVADSGFESFITGGPDGLDATVHPYVQFSGGNWPGVASLGDFLGLPAGIGIPHGGAVNVSALPFRAYQLIWNEYFRDQDLQTAAALSTADGADATTSIALQNVAWQKDYYTTARPWEAKGPSISMFPAGVTLPVKGIGIGQTGQTDLASSAFFDTAQGAVTYPHARQASTSANFVVVQADSASSTANPLVFATSTGSGFVGADINALRRQFALQRFQEARARYGSRYVEYLRYLGVRSSDARLQRPEYLGGGTSTLQFSEVLQTGVTTSGTASGVGTMYGHGITAQRTNRFRRFFEEHGIVMTLASVRPVTVYTQPLYRGWLRGMTGAGGAATPTCVLGTREDYFQRELQNIGQQQINPAEVDAGNNGVGDAAFGFQDRYDDYRRRESFVTGQFRTALANLNTWHFARSFASAVPLNSTFISCVPSVLPFADQSHDQLYCMFNHSIQARRMISKHGGSYVR